MGSCRALGRWLPGLFGRGAPDCQYGHSKRARNSCCLLGHLSAGWGLRRYRVSDLGLVWRGVRFLGQGRAIYIGGSVSSSVLELGMASWLLTCRRVMNSRCVSLFEDGRCRRGHVAWLRA